MERKIMMSNCVSNLFMLQKVEIKETEIFSKTHKMYIKTKVRDRKHRFSRD